jgi:hypothetical protein
MRRPSKIGRGAFWGTGMGAFTHRKMPVSAIMYMKKQGLIENSRDLPEIVYR